MQPVSKVMTAIPTKNLDVVLETSILPKIAKAESKLHDYVPKMPIKITSQEVVPEKATEYVLDFFG